MPATTKFKFTKQDPELYSALGGRVYEVRLDGVLLGTVESTQVQHSRMAGRLRASDSYTTEWRWLAVNGPRRPYIFRERTRQRAAEELLKDFRASNPAAQ